MVDRGLGWWIGAFSGRRGWQVVGGGNREKTCGVSSCTPGIYEPTKLKTTNCTAGALNFHGWENARNVCVIVGRRVTS